MGEYRPISFEEYMAGLSGERRRRIEERSRVLSAEIEFWNGLPEAERNKVAERPKVHYDRITDTLWLKNGRPTPRHCDIVKGWVTAYFEAEIWYPSAVRISGADALLAGFFRPGDSQVSRWPVVQYGENGVLEKALQVGNLEIKYTMIRDYLWIGNGVPAWDGREFADEVSVSYDENGKVPVGALINPAAKILAPIFSQVCAAKPARLI